MRLTSASQLNHLASSEVAIATEQDEQQDRFESGPPAVRGCDDQRLLQRQHVFVSGQARSRAWQDM